MGKIFNKLITKYFKNEEWLKARKIITKELKKSPNDHWLLTRLATTYYEEFNYDKALKYSEKAYHLFPNCPLVIWDYACDLDMKNYKKRAISLWKQLVKSGVEKIAHGECGEGIRWAKSLINDCKYRIGISYYNLGKKKEALTYIKSHLINRKRGQPSIYPLKHVRKIYKKMQVILR